MNQNKLEKQTQNTLRKPEKNIILDALNAHSNGKSNKEIANFFLKDFCENQIIDGMIETSKLYLGTLTFIEGEPTGMLIGYNLENNIDEKCILYPVMMTPHNGTVFLDIINQTLLETKSNYVYGFPKIHKAGVLVEKEEPLNKVMNKEIVEIDELKRFLMEINHQKQKTKK